MKFTKDPDGKYRMMTSEGLFVADGAKFTIKEVNNAFEKGLFALMDFTTKKGDAVYCIQGHREAVGKDYDDGITIKTKAPIAEAPRLKVTINQEKV
jgi:hypothetical protein